MASPANILRLCLRPSRRLPSLRAAALQQSALRRPLSTTQWRAAAAEDGAKSKEAEDEADQAFSNPGQFLTNFLRDEKITDEERQLAKRMLADWHNVPPHMKKEFDKLNDEITEESAYLRRPMLAKRDSFWNTEESDPDLITDEVGEDDFEEDDIMAMGHAKLEEHREFREYARLAVWEMPLLSKLAKPFQPPTEQEVLRFRYTTYMGEFHPADRKVVVEFCPRDIPGLTEAQQLKLKKLAGARYNPEKDIVKMSSERFEHQAQNKRYLGDLVDKMIATAKDPTDMFEDVPLDTRHHTFKPKIKFPKEWYLTEERKKELEAQRKQALLLDEGKRTEGLMIDGVQTIQKALLTAKVEEPVVLTRVRSTRGRR
ncbi:mitochondrial ribosomal subunit protein-domain-containing protein [Parachaetomium inaequale]|uniref:Small ribosomal subunit protein mS35 n=1 Tax=Parachaetomium inaequale TaxID=2588326 RepID=A0AAN6PM71_9PEZI|nr:mitochondrial ribosomal subunit protein-domain-containing protein [Parachaetomium inaequale]